jgi:hypothetical protein
MHFFANGDNLISSLLNLNERFFCLFVQLAPSLYLLNKSCGKQTNADRINLQPQYFFDQLTSKAWPQQHSRNHHIKQILNAGHAL